MKSPTSIGRVVGGLLLLQFVGMFLAFSTLMAGVGTDYLSKAGSMESTIRIAVILLFVNSAIALAMSVMAFPVLREHSVRTAVALVAVGAVWIAMQSVDNAHIMSMLSMSKRLAESPGADQELYNAVGASLHSTRRFIHYSTLLVIDVWFALFYGVLFVFRLVPRWLGGLGLLAVALHAIGVSLTAFIGYAMVAPLAYAFAAAYLVFGAWLIWKGFSVAKSGLQN